MKTPLLLVLLCSVSLGLAAEPFKVYAPSPSSNSLWVIDATPTASGMTLELSEKVALASSVRGLCAHPEKPILYLSPAAKGATQGSTVFLDETGRYERHVDTPLVHGLGFLSLDRTSQFLLGSNYGGGTVDVYRLEPDGSIGARAYGLNEGRKNAHCALLSPNNRFLYIPYVKDTNAVFQYAFDEKTGALTALDPKNALPPEGTGPRHLTYHPEKPIVYFSNEQHVGVSAYDIGDDGRLTLREVVDLVGAEIPEEGRSASDILITPNGRFVFTGIRGKDTFNYIARYEVAEDGSLTGLGVTKADAIPWGLALSPDGQYLLVAASAGKTLTAFSIEDDGDLETLASFDWGETITDLVTR